MFFVPSHLNRADWFYRGLCHSDTVLSSKSWGVVERYFGGINGQTLDLMSLDSNVNETRKGILFSHFTPYPTPESAVSISGFAIVAALMHTGFCHSHLLGLFCVSLRRRTQLLQ